MRKYLRKAVAAVCWEIGDFFMGLYFKYDDREGWTTITSTPVTTWTTASSTTTNVGLQWTGHSGLI